MMPTPKKRPSGVPIDAVWSADDDEWVLTIPNPTNPDLVVKRFYRRSDGSLVAECPYLGGAAHGMNVRYHNHGAVASETPYVHDVIHGRAVHYPSALPSDEPAIVQNPSAVRVEFDVVHGVNESIRIFDAAGRELTRDGEPLPERPRGVDSIATFENGVWIAGRWDLAGKRLGLTRIWQPSGELLREAEYQDNRRHGMMVEYRAGQTRLRAVYVRGQLEGELVLFGDDGAQRKTVVRSGQHAGELVDIDPQGSVVRRVTWTPLPTPAIHGRPHLGDGDLAALAEGTGTPRIVALAVALGWGGVYDDRDGQLARRCRTAVFSHGPASVCMALTALDLHLAPRISTVSRLRRVLDALRNDASVDYAMLCDTFADQGGETVGAFIAEGGERCVRQLAKRVRSKAQRSDALDAAAMNLAYCGLSELPDDIGRFALVTSINLESNALTTLNPHVADMVFLEKLELGRNRIRELPSELALLTELRTVLLPANGFSDLPRGLVDLSRLEVLDLSANQLRGLPEEVAKLRRLHSLWLTDNPLVSLPASFAQLECLRFLHLGGIPIDEPPSVVFDLPALEELWIASPHLRRLPPAVGKLRRLRRLHLWYSPLEALPEELFGLTTLEEVRLSNTKVPREQIERLRTTLPNCKLY